MNKSTLPLSVVRDLMLHAQGLSRPFSGQPDNEDVLQTIRQIQILQIDTIHVVARSPYLVLWSRLGDYDPKWLDQLLTDKKIFEFWSHEACFIPAEDYPITRTLISAGLKGWPDHCKRWMAEHPEPVQAVLSQMAAQGFARSADFERKDGKKGTWWNRKEEKTALECLFNTGEVMILRRHNFQRIYAPQPSVRPDWHPDQMPLLDDALDSMIRRTIGVLGIAHPRWVWDYFRLPKTLTAERISKLLASGEILSVEVDGWKEAGLILPETMSLLDAALQGEMASQVTTLLSPFDPLIWDRERTKSLFNFDYRLECYTPAPKRKYGYFLLPILDQGQLIGRLDAKAHRQNGKFEIKSFYLEDDFEPTPETVHRVAAAISRCASWHKTPQVELADTVSLPFAHKVMELCSLNTSFVS